MSEDDNTRRRAFRLFDLRRVIGGLFLVYGAILTVVGLLDSDAALRKAEGVRINLWAGLAMLAFGALFVLWERLRPVDPDAVGAEDDPTDSEG
ncbi:hypothetical protein Sru01_08600 [Sphaerisporangium rufum]|uniref:Uncharacterized protein n=1 Tax=Sphaerisporangium rufum TaxID=1381558 RepID=A0A919QYX4_9ACTN|nr:hypothetical protein [Sphaerisporangium rufum]GII75878.1 hypothetical protein Sru01_08600 [Sphaerisporangium rufum]